MLRAPATAQSVTLSTPGTEPLLLELAAGAQAVAALEIADPGAVLEIAIEAQAAPETEAPDARPLGIGVISAKACAADDLAARLAYLERQRFVWPEPV